MGYDPDEAIGTEETKPLSQQMGEEPDYGSDAYAYFIDDAKKDDAIGKHDWLVTGVDHGYWPSGDPRIKIVGQLIDVRGNNKPKADLTISPPPSPATLKAEWETYDKGKQRAITQAITMYRKLREYYQTSPDKIVEGDIFAVETGRARAQNPGQLGFLRVTAFHSKDKIGAAGQSQSAVPF